VGASFVRLLLRRKPKLPFQPRTTKRKFIEICLPAPKSPPDWSQNGLSNIKERVEPPGWRLTGFAKPFQRTSCSRKLFEAREGRAGIIVPDSIIWNIGPNSKPVDWVLSLSSRNITHALQEKWREKRLTPSGAGALNSLSFASFAQKDSDSKKSSAQNINGPVKFFVCKQILGENLLFPPSPRGFSDGIRRSRFFFGWNHGPLRPAFGLRGALRAPGPHSKKPVFCFATEQTRSCCAPPQTTRNKGFGPVNGTCHENLGPRQPCLRIPRKPSRPSHRSGIVRGPCPRKECFF